MTETFVGCQVGAISFVDEGYGTVLDTLVEQAQVNAILFSAISWSRGNAGRATTGFPDHGVTEPDVLEGGAFYQTHERYFSRSPMHRFPAPEPYYQGRDFLGELIPEARQRGVAVYPYYCETAGAGHRPVSIPNFAHYLEIDHRGRKASRPCVNHPDYRTWIYSIIEDWCSSYPIDGIVWGIERRGALLNLLWGDTGTCFCPHCAAKAHQQNVDVLRAREGYQKLDDYLNSIRDGAVPRDGYFVEFLRVLMQYPEIFVFEKFWRESHSEMHREIYGLVKWLDPNLQVGMHVWQVTNTYSALLKAQYPYAEMVHYADFLKPVVYHTPAGSRFTTYTAKLQETILKGGDREIQPAVPLFDPGAGRSPTRGPRQNRLLRRIHRPRDGPRRRRRRRQDPRLPRHQHRRRGQPQRPQHQPSRREGGCQSVVRGRCHGHLALTQLLGGTPGKHRRRRRCPARPRHRSRPRHPQKGGDRPHRLVGHGPIPARPFAPSIRRGGPPCPPGRRPRRRLSGNAVPDANPCGRQPGGHAEGGPPLRRQSSRDRPDAERSECRTPNTTRSRT